jgi:spermidine synthase
LGVASLTFPIRSNKLSMSVEVKEHILHRQTEFQAIDIYDTFAFGRVLLLDGHIQLAELDERAYHEALVHVPLLSVESPKSALVVGGGDGGVLRELVKHGSLERIEMVEIDAAVIEASREYLPFVSGGAFDDPRVRVHVEDAFAFLKRAAANPGLHTGGEYDLVVMDVTDVYEEEEGELSERLFTEEFHVDCRSALSNRGFLVSQADNNVFCPYSMEEIQRTLASLFPKTGWYQALVPSFGGFSGYCWASKSGAVLPEMPKCDLDLAYLSPTTWKLAMQKLPFCW